MRSKPNTPEPSGPPDAGRPALDAAYWEDCYQRGEMRWEKGAPSPGLVDFLSAHPDLRRGTVLSPGCGTAHDVCAWARAGFSATGIDLAPSAIRLATERAASAGLTATFRQADFLHDPPYQQFDCIWEHTLFCAIHPEQREDYLQAVLRWLRPDGTFLAVHYLIREPDGPPFGTTKDELVRHFRPHFHLRESWVPRSYPNRTGLELMMWWHRRAGRIRSAEPRSRAEGPSV